MKRLRLAAVLALALAATASAAERRPQLLIFSGTSGYRHDSIEAGTAAIEALARRQGFEVRASESAAAFDNLAGVTVIVLLSNTTDRERPESEPLTGSRGEALQRFVRDGGGVVAVHAAADSHYHWPWYGRLIGGRFERHPPGTPKGSLSRTGRKHPISRRLPARFDRVDEWYYFADFDPGSDLLVTLDPASIGEKDVNPNPISWAREVEGGRVFYTAMGHTKESYSERLFLEHLAAGLRWAAGR